MRVLLIVLICSLSTRSLFARIGPGEPAVPRKYASTFKADQLRFYAATHTSDSIAGRTFNIWQAAKKGSWKDFNVDSVYDLAEKLREEAFVRKVNFLRSNPKSYASLYNLRHWVLNSSLIVLDTLRNLYYSLSSGLRQTPLGREVALSIKRKAALQIGKVPPDFSFITIDGTKLRISSLRQKGPVLLCFWASWCGPCLRSLPKVRMIDSSYKELGLQVIGISIDKDAYKWKESVRQNNMTWLQTCDLPTYNSSKSLALLYEVTSVPRYILLDPEGYVIYNNFLLDDNDDFEKLQQILQTRLRNNLPSGSEQPRRDSAQHGLLR
jgi:peroxiredoxin